MVTEEQIQQHYEKFMEYIKADSRAEQLIKMYEDFTTELVTAPASAKVFYHNAFPGGYIDHVLRVTETSLQIAAQYKKMGGTIDFTKQELIFAALHHDLGKLGNPDQGPYYLEQDSDWHRKNRGEMYKHNENIQYFTVTDRALFTLQKYGVPVTEKEWLGIKLSDGMYEDSNKAYYKCFVPNAMKTNLPYILHWADHMSCRTEGDTAKF
jgi:predicted HD phosphohydrolase